MRGQDASVAVGVCHEQDHEIDSAVTTLQGNATIECLKVRQVHLRFDRDDRVSEPNLGIPGA
jgi:hypothetical protein